MSLHTFDPNIAAKVGINAAIIYQNLIFWTQKNMANGRHIHDGHVWTYNSVKAWADMFPYLSGNQVRRALAKLIETGMIAEGNYNKSAYDRTKWYGVSTQIHLCFLPNGFGEKHEPIPDVNTDNNTDSKQEVAIAPVHDAKSVKDKRDVIASILSMAVSYQTAMAFVQHRIELKKPMTENAANAMLKKLEGHPDPDAVLTDSIANGWQGIFPEKTNARNTYDQRKSTDSMGGGQSANGDATLRAIAYAATARPAPSDDIF